MKFGPVNTEQSAGAILAHSVQLAAGKRLRKGVVIDQSAISDLLDHNIKEIIVASLEEGDVHENEASAKIAAWLVNQHIRGDEAFTGRVNLFANQSGVFEVDKNAVNLFNGIDPAITIATLRDKVEVTRDTMVATIKIIPYAASSKSLEQIRQVCESHMLTIHPYRKKRIGLISTLLPSVPEKVHRKTQKVLEQRLQPSTSEIIEARMVEHTAEEVRKAVLECGDQCDLLIIFGASAISDEMDVIPAGVMAAGGEILRFGMPVDPGNLLMLGRISTTDIIGAPGCARSPVENGFDWVLQRLLADMPVDGDLISNMGVGGLLKEIISRPQPRQSRPTEKQPKLGAIILAAGQSRRMGNQNKLTATLDGKSLVRTVADVALTTFDSSNIFAVSGHQPEKIETELSGLGIRLLHNPDYEDGLSTSLVTGITHIPDHIDGVLILLADMPKITEEGLKKLVEAFQHAPADSIIVSTHGGKRGNPVLWPRSYFETLKQVQGDVGARHILGQNTEKLVEIELGPAASFDIDTPEALNAAGGEFVD